MTTSTVSANTLYLVDFSIEVESIEEASDLWRGAIDSVKSLSDSLIGESPLCADGLCIDLAQHAEARSFKTEDGMNKFSIHLINNLLAKCGGSRRPTFNIYSDGSILYVVDSQRASISLFKDGRGKWQVCGWAIFRDPKVAERKLRLSGFFTTCEAIAA